MDTTLLQDTFKYFAKFPLTSGVEKNFNVTTSQRFGADYSDFRSQVNNLTEKELIPGIEDYIFGVNEDMVKRRVQDITGIYLFVDYGSISSEYETDAKVQQDKFNIALTVGYPIKENELDAVETMLMHQQSLDFISTIKEKMHEDSKKNPFVKQIELPVEITPWFSRELMNSNGWSMVFAKKGVELI
jgi:hypothetical protein